MRIKTIAVNYERKFNLGDYNSVTLGCSLWATIDPDEDKEACIMIAQDKAKNGSKPVETFRVNVEGEQDKTTDAEFLAEGDEYRIDHQLT